MKLFTALSTISIDDVRSVRERAARLTHARKSYAERCQQIILQYPAAGLLMTLPVRTDHDLFTESKINGYRWSCLLLATLAETADGLADALASISDAEMLAVVQEILRTDRMAFARWYLLAGEECYGFAQGMWEEFQFMLEEGKNEESLGLLMIAGGLIMLAENRDP